MLELQPWRTMRRKRWGAFLALACASACSTEFTPEVCAVDDDCGDGLVCELRGERTTCVAAADAPIVIGSSSATTGTNQALGTQMKLGIELAIDEQNADGGIRGRQIVLQHRDDGYDPPLAESAARDLIDVEVRTGTPPRCPSTEAEIAGNPPISADALERGPDAVLAMLGSVGTPTMVRAAPVAVETHTIFFGAFTGAATVLRNTAAGDCARYIFNVRASYAQEAYATMEFFEHRGVDNYRKLISFDQNDSFGQAGYDGLVAAYVDVIGAFPGSADPEEPIARFRYTRNDNDSVPEQAMRAEAYLVEVLETFGGTVHVGVMMTDTYGAADEFIRHVRDWQYDGQDPKLGKDTRLELYFSNVSFVGPNALSERLVDSGTYQTPDGPVAYATDVVVSQVVPNYQSDLSDVVVDYRNRIAETPGATAGFTSLEGYISTRVFIAGLLNNEGPFTPESMIAAFETLPDLGLGIGATAGFRPCPDTDECGAKHQYSNSVWGTILNADGEFRNLYFWRDGSPIQFFE
jgi:hypothetical protein